MGSRGSGSSGGGARVVRETKTNRDGTRNIRDGLTDMGREARNRDQDYSFGVNDHAWSTLNGNGCGSCHSSDPGRFSQRSSH